MPLRKERSSAKFIIVAKFLTSKALNIDAIIRTFNPLWHTINGFKARSVGDDVILFVFDDEEKVEKIFRGKPWSFDKHLVVLKKYEKHSPVYTLSFSKVFIWVQIHDIPVRFRNKKVAEDLGTVIGEVAKTTKLAEMEGGSFIRIQVRIDITLPLCQGKIIALEEGSEDWVKFKFERLPNIFYCVGVSITVTRTATYGLIAMVPSMIRSMVFGFMPHLLQIHGGR
ncbi:uncharacterized protein LOC126702727 [Quercus robur]|uniref:uncharacterized protein LOC126702727 n=1 Tax=Quercus robur TaxID=38942 RepID=UPI002162BCDD|nr:uncharacterized protein LOC126702727 [Quercus robur]